MRLALAFVISFPLLAAPAAEAAKSGDRAAPKSLSRLAKKAKQRAEIAFERHVASRLPKASIASRLDGITATAILDNRLDGHHETHLARRASALSSRLKGGITFYAERLMAQHLFARGDAEIAIELLLHRTLRDPSLAPDTFVHGVRLGHFTPSSISMNVRSYDGFRLADLQVGLQFALIKAQAKDPSGVESRRLEAAFGIVDEAFATRRPWPRK